MNYGDLISRAFRITIRHRFLWLLAILAGGGGFSFQYRYRMDSDVTEPFPEAVQRVFEWMAAHIHLVVALGIIFSIIFLLLFIISIMAKGGLIASAAAIEARQPVSFMKGMRDGYHAFWRLFAVALIIGLAIMASLIFLALPVIVLALTKHYWAAVIVGLLLLPIFVALTIYLGLLLMYAERCVVIHATGLIGSITRAHHILFTFRKEVILVWLLAFAIGFGAAFASVLLILLLALPHVAIGILVYRTLGLIPTIACAVLPALVLLAVSLLAAGISGAFRSTFWTLAYLDLTRLSEQTAPADPGTALA